MGIAVLLMFKKFQLPCNTLAKVFCKHHGIRHFGVGYKKGIVCVQND